jgi:hypothetical protein
MVNVLDKHDQSTDFRNAYSIKWYLDVKNVETPHHNA